MPSSRLNPNAPKSVEFLPEGVWGVMVIPFGNVPLTGMLLGILAENCGARAARAGVASSRFNLFASQNRENEMIGSGTYGAGTASTVIPMARMTRV